MATVSGTSGNDLIQPGSPASYTPDGGDSISGLDGDDTIYSGSDNDTVYGGSGNDIIDGGVAADSLYGDAGDDTVYGGSGNDTIEAGDGNDVSYGGDGDDTIYFGMGDDTVYGGDGDDRIDDVSGGSLTGTNLLYGGAGNDTLWAGDDNDALYGDEGNDFLYGEAGNDVAYGGTGNDVLNGGVGLDTLFGDVGGDVLYGAIGDDVLYGGADNDTLSGGADNDTLYGDIGDDTLTGDAGNDVAYGGTGNDVMNGNVGLDTLFGDAGNDVLYGGTGNDVLYGGAENDVLTGGAGTDSIFGGDERDQIFVTYTKLSNETIAGNAVQNDILGNEAVDGGSGAGATSDNDTLTVDVTGMGWTRIDLVYIPSDHESGTITFFNGSGAVVGRLTFTDIENLIILCFTPGTQILTERGAVAVEDLGPGDMVLTRDNGLQPLRWVGSRVLSYAELQARPELQPVRIAAGALAGAGPDRTMLVSPQHRVLIAGARAELYFGESEVLVPAKHLTGLAEISRALPAEGVTYVHILFDRHEIVQSDGIWTESFQPAQRTLNALDEAARAEVLDLFPELSVDAAGFSSARLSLKAYEAKVLLSG